MLACIHSSATFNTKYDQALLQRNILENCVHLSIGFPSTLQKYSAVFWKQYLKPLKRFTRLISEQNTSYTFFWHCAISHFNLPENIKTIELINTVFYLADIWKRNNFVRGINFLRIWCLSIKTRITAMAQEHLNIYAKQL